VDARIGVLALQGDVSEHIRAFEEALRAAGCNSPVVPVKKPEDLAPLDALAIPGGESTTISRLIEKNGMYQPLSEFEGGIFATCAGMVLMASEADDPRVRTLGRMDMHVARNAFGRQRESHEVRLDVAGLDSPFPAVFIRAPVATRVGSGVQALGAIDRGIVAVRQGKHMAFSFHPELVGDLRLHTLFLKHLGR